MLQLYWILKISILQDNKTMYPEMIFCTFNMDSMLSYDKLFCNKALLSLRNLSYWALSCSISCP